MPHPTRPRTPETSKPPSYGAVLLRIAVAVEALEEGQARLELAAARIEGNLNRALCGRKPTTQSTRRRMQNA